MACTATYNTASPTLGSYGIYNDFYVFVENVSGSTTNLKFRIRVTDGNSDSYTLDVVPNAANDAIVQPLLRLRDTFFKSDYTGGIESTNTEGWNTVQIEVGEISGTPATFQGYDTDDTFYFYNGYSKDQQQALNYREPSWYNTSPYLLPKTKKNIYCIEDYPEILSIPNPLNLSSGVYNATTLTIEFYEEDPPLLPVLLSTVTVDLTTRGPALSGTGYWNYNINENAQLYDGTTTYAEVTVTWDTGEATTVDSEAIRLYPLPCQPKYEAYRLRWINRYGGEEFENFQMKATESIAITRGKKILSSGADYDSTTFAGIKNVNEPQLSEFGKTYQRNFTLRTDWITQEQIESLEECFTSPAVLMFTPDYDIFSSLTGEGLFPVNVESSSYEILDVKQGLKKVEITVSIANRQPSQLQ